MIFHEIIKEIEKNEFLSEDSLSKEQKKSLILNCNEKTNVNIDIINILKKLNTLNSDFVEEVGHRYSEKIVLKNCNMLFDEKNNISTGKRMALIPLLTDIAINKKDLTDEDNAALLLFCFIPFKYNYKKLKAHLSLEGSPLIYNEIIKSPIYELNKSQDLEAELFMLKLKYECYLLKNTIINNEKKQKKRL